MSCHRPVEIGIIFDYKNAREQQQAMALVFIALAAGWS